MNDPRLLRLAEILIDHSCQLQAGEKILIEAFDLPEPTLVCRLVELAAQRGAHPVTTLKSNAVLRSLYANGTATNLGLAGQFEAARMKEMDAYIGVRGAADCCPRDDRLSWPDNRSTHALRSTDTTKP